jgi:molybdopterin molybdotransferase
MTDLLSVEAAQAAVLAGVDGPLPVESRPVTEALGRVLAAPVKAATDLPPWDNSAMDGYAIRAADVAEATEDRPVRLPVLAEVAAGSAPLRALGPGEAFRIATGAPVPAGADAVVQVELTTPLDASGLPSGPRGRDATGPLPPACLVHAAIGPGANIRRRGDDLRAGSRILDAGTVLTPAGVAVSAGSGVVEVRVHGRPRIAVLATGDEVVPAGEPLGPAGIPDANGPGIRALVAAAGAEPVDLGIASDRLDVVLGRIGSVLPAVDAVIVSGGVSVGPYDVVREAFAALGRVDLWRVAVQPGKPFAFGVAERTQAGVAGRSGRVLLFGLPGNPVSGFVTFDLFVRPAIRRLAGRRDLLDPADRAVLLDEASKGSGRRAFLRVIAERDAAGAVVRDAEGRVRVRLAGRQGSHVLSALAMADGYAVIPEHIDRVVSGTAVELHWIER